MPGLCNSQHAVILKVRRRTRMKEGVFIVYLQKEKKKKHDASSFNKTHRGVSSRERYKHFMSHAVIGKIMIFLEVTVTPLHHPALTPRHDCYIK